MLPRITVIGAANVDISATSLGKFRQYDSNPSLVRVCFGGVGRNIAHNLVLMGAEVRFLTVFGDDIMSQTLYDDCERLDMKLEPAVLIRNARSNYFVCINDEHGEMQAGAADIGLLDNLTPEHIEKEFKCGETAEAVVADCNLREDTLKALATNCKGSLYIDATSAAKSVKIKSLLSLPAHAPLIVKVNRLEASQVSGVDADAKTMAERIIALGAERVYITLGAEGVFCHDGKTGTLVPSECTQIVNATGAGDAFMAGMIMGEINGKEICEATQWGMNAASMALQSQHPVNPDISLEIIRGKSDK